MRLDEITHNLTELSLAQIELTLPQFLSVIELLEKLRILLGEDHLYTQRCIGLAKGTNKEDPLQCGFVLRAMHEMFTTNAADLAKVRALLVELAGRV